MADSSTIKKLEELSVHCEDGGIENKENIDTNNNKNNEQSNEDAVASLLKGHIQQVKKKKVLARLHLFNRDGTVKQIVEMKKYKFIIGSDQKSTDILITRPGVYSNHAELIYDKEVRKFYLNPLVDPNISDTIRINFIPFINKKEILGNNDVISIGLRAFRIEFFAPVYVDNLILPPKIIPQQQQHQPTQKKYKQEIENILSSTPTTNLKKPPTTTTTTIKTSKTSKTSKPVEAPPKPISKKSTQSKPLPSTSATKPITLAQSSSSKTHKIIEGDSRLVSDKKLQELKNKKTGSSKNKNINNIIGKQKTTNDQYEDGDNEESDDEGEDEEEKEDSNNSEEDSESENEEELVPKTSNPQPQNKSALSTSVSVKQPTEKTLKTTLPLPKPKPSTTLKTKISSQEPKINQIIKKTTETTSITTTTKGKETETITLKSTITSKQPKLAQIPQPKKELENPEVASIRKKVEKFIKEFERVVVDKDFTKLSEEKKKIKKSLDSISKVNYIFEKENSELLQNPIDTDFKFVPYKELDDKFILGYYSTVNDPVSITSILNNLKNEENYKLTQVLKDFEKIITNVSIFHKNPNEYWWYVHQCNIQFYKSLANNGLINKAQYETQLKRSKVEIKKIHHDLVKGLRLVGDDDDDDDDNNNDIEEKENQFENSDSDGCNDDNNKDSQSEGEENLNTREHPPTNHNSDDSEYEDDDHDEDHHSEGNKLDSGDDMVFKQSDDDDESGEERDEIKDDKDESD
ncbi:hypothetical protein RB653_004576 [Dictyostelium firmibasis]|uniref:Bromo domain-containing protein n=1 Tax=Dictyostelium firmibasis TaxID=79012 RepID=A0AAN7U7R0_9MYCE